MKKILIIRFSSFGDIIQTISASRALKQSYPNCQLVWITRSDFSQFLEAEPSVDKVVSFQRSSGFKGLLSLTKNLVKENFDLIYDAHNNLRSSVMKFIIRMKSNSIIITRPKDRIKRFLFFNFRINQYKNWPFKGVKSFTDPLNHVFKNHDNLKPLNWKFSKETQKKVNNLLGDYSNFIALVPSAAWEVKRWPLKYWQELVTLLPNNKFVIIAGPKDDFTKEISKINNLRILNLTGELSFLESSLVIAKAEKVISGDTGFLHVADLFSKKGIALIGPTAFGYTTNKSIKILEVELNCKPCTKDGRSGCKNKIYQKCMLDIKPKTVVKVLQKL